ncbi:hypothetical protein VTO73DRAFT_14486 [Trametes versicolor]
MPPLFRIRPTRTFSNGQPKSPSSPTIDVTGLTTPRTAVVLPAVSADTPMGQIYWACEVNDCITRSSPQTLFMSLKDLREVLRAAA